jgi:threonine synthase
VKYVSTRGEAPELGFEDVLLTGLARDGGLYVPKIWPQLTPDDLRSMRGKSYQEIAFQVMNPFIGGAVFPDHFRRMIDDAYASFGHAAVTPLKQLDAKTWLLELFHGPTLAFKDVAMQLLALLMDHVLEHRGTTATIIGATSGDTGGAAIEAFKSSKRSRIVILHPHGRVTDVQRRQMTTVTEKNVHNIAIEGDFDACQAIVKALFNDIPFRDDVRLSGVNSINWARIMAQIVYYVHAATQIGTSDRPASFSVPTGNFGDAFAGYAAKRMGLPVDRIIVATNVNDILHRTLDTGRYEVRRVTPSSSPSMDIQVSSNFERMIYEASHRDAAMVRRLMSGLSQSGDFMLDEATLQAIRRACDSAAVDEKATFEEIKRTLEETGELLDPHTAVARAASRPAEVKGPMVVLATAHPAKFPDAVEKASGIRPHLPQRLSHLLNAPERFTVLPNSSEAVRDFVLALPKGQ